MDDDQTSGAQGGQALQTPFPPVLHQPNIIQPPVSQQISGQFAGWPGLDIQHAPGSAPLNRAQLPTPAGTYTGRFLSQSTRYVKDIL